MKKILFVVVALVAIGAFVVSYRSSAPSEFTGTKTANGIEIQSSESSAVVQAPAINSTNKSTREAEQRTAASSPVAGTATAPAATTTKDKTADDPFNYGRTPSVRPDANANTRSVVEAFQGKGKPERLSALGSPKPFNLEEYRANPKAYLDVVEPARALRPAQPGKDVPRIQALNPTLQHIEQGQSVTLRVNVAPNVPVTFTSFDCGRFEENKLTTVTVESNKQGIATATFHAPPGTIENVNILAASPVTSGQVRYVVNVTKSMAAANAKN